MKKRFGFSSLLTSLTLLLSGCFGLFGPTKDTYTIRWVDYDNTLLEIDEKVKKDETPTYDGPTPTRESDGEYTYKFYGWSPKVKPAYRDQTYTAKYSATKIEKYYTVVLKLTEDEEYETQVIKEGDKVQKPKYNPYRLGYNFSYWSYRGESYDFNTYVYEDMVIEAVWVPIEYKFTYSLNGGTFVSDYPLTYTIEDDFDLPLAYKKGYTSTGWLTKDNRLISRIDKGSYGDLYLTAQWNDGNKYEVSLDPNGGEISTTSLEVQYDHNYSLPCPTRLGYTFLGWYSDGYKYSSSGKWTIEGDKSFIAMWEINNYSITYILNDGINDKDNPETYTVEDEIIFKDATREGYTFLGWFNNDGSRLNKIEKGNIGNVTLNAKWNDGNAYVITLDPNGGTLDDTSIDVNYDHEYTLPIVSRTGYVFDGWFDNNIKVENTGTYKYAESKTFLAKWTAISYPIEYILNGGTNSDDNPISYTIEDEITLENPSKDGYTFIGWTNSSEETITKISLGSYGNISLTANWDANLNEFTLTSEDILKGSVSLLNGEGHTDEQMTVKATPNNGYTFDGWYSLGSRVSVDDTYTFTMPTSDYSLEARFATNEDYEWGVNHGTIPYLDEVNKTITYGLYPQNHIDDESLINSLNALEEVEDNGWYLYNDEYYTFLISSPYSNAHFNNNTLISKNTKYWFKCEPIVWDILSYENYDYLLFSDLLLETCKYQVRWSGLDENNRYANNYEYSLLREWFNNDFYFKAFSLDVAHILNTLVDNSANSMQVKTSKYASEDTNDKVFTLSYVDLINPDYGFSNNASSSAISRQAKTSEYARAMGAYGVSPDFLGYYYTRSPYWAFDYEVNLVRTNGTISSVNVDNQNNTYCARPAISLTLL